MALRYYKNGPARALAFPLANATDTAITVDSAAGFPTQFPYTLILDPDQSTEEVVDVSAAVGNVLTITRGVDTTTAVAHAAGAVVYHGISARDPREANEHVNATTNVHGRTGSLLDTDSVQTITGRKLFVDAESSTGGNFVDTSNVQAITGAKTFDSLSTTAGGAVVALAGAQTITGAKTFTGTETHQGTEAHSGPATFTGGLSTGAGAVVAVAGAQTISNKTFDSSNILPIKGNTETVNTDSGGFAVVTHGLGVIPDYVVATPHNTTNYYCSVQARTSTTFTLIIVHKNDTVLASGAITVSWIAR